MSGYISIKVKLDFQGLKEQKELIEGLIEYHKDDDAMIQLNGINRLLEFLISEGEEKGFYKKEATK
jgi:hypothetical protein